MCQDCVDKLENEVERLKLEIIKVEGQRDMALGQLGVRLFEALALVEVREYDEWDENVHQPAFARLYKLACDSCYKRPT